MNFKQKSLIGNASNNSRWKGCYKRLPYDKRIYFTLQKEALYFQMSSECSNRDHEQLPSLDQYIKTFARRKSHFQRRASVDVLKRNIQRKSSLKDMESIVNGLVEQKMQGQKITRTEKLQRMLGPLKDLNSFISLKDYFESLYDSIKEKDVNKNEKAQKFKIQKSYQSLKAFNMQKVKEHLTVNKEYKFDQASVRLLKQMETEGRFIGKEEQWADKELRKITTNYDTILIKNKNPHSFRKVACLTETYKEINPKSLLEKKRQSVLNSLKQQKKEVKNSQIIAQRSKQFARRSSNASSCLKKKLHDQLKMSNFLDQSKRVSSVIEKKPKLIQFEEKSKFSMKHSKLLNLPQRISNKNRKNTIQMKMQRILTELKGYKENTNRTSESKTRW